MARRNTRGRATRTVTTVAVVGTGALTSQGAGAAALWEGARAGRVAIRPVQHIDMRGLATKLGGEVEGARTAPRGYRRPKGHRERALDLALAAAEEALAALAELPEGTVAPTRFGLVLG
ncbi:beta-ketoacyl synthase N-terminal-like domain-containing protein, partial [Streptomyces sp. 2MCAF27]